MGVFALSSIWRDVAQRRGGRNAVPTVSVIEVRCFRDRRRDRQASSTSVRAGARLLWCNVGMTEWNEINNFVRTLFASYCATNKTIIWMAVLGVWFIVCIPAGRNAFLATIQAHNQLIGFQCDVPLLLLVLVSFLRYGRIFKEILMLAKFALVFNLWKIFNFRHHY